VRTISKKTTKQHLLLGNRFLISNYTQPLSLHKQTGSHGNEFASNNRGNVGKLGGGQAYDRSSDKAAVVA
jgi:hypothetical protein